MKRRMRGWIVAVAVLSAVNGMVLANASDEHGPTRYRKVHGPDTMPYRIVLTHCRNAEDTMAELRVIEYEPERVVYGCVAP